MKNDMHLIMENWRKHTINEGFLDSVKRFFGFPPKELDEPTDFTNVQTAGDFFNKIVSAVKIAALYEKQEFRKEITVGLGMEVVDTSLEFVKATPVVGNAISLGKALIKSAQTVEMGMELLAKSKEVNAAVAKSLKGIAGRLIAIDDSNIDKHPLAKIFNISDQKEAVLRKQEIDNFANYFLAYIKNFPNAPVGDATTYADRMLVKYLQTKRGFEFT
tara:strand:+ start:166 stop:816 length:651 start_codon:yes stop_codon:yes gene_type:complete